MRKGLAEECGKVEIEVTQAEWYVTRGEDNWSDDQKATFSVMCEQKGGDITVSCRPDFLLDLQCKDCNEENKNKACQFKGVEHK